MLEIFIYMIIGSLVYNAIKNNIKKEKKKRPLPKWEDYDKRKEPTFNTAVKNFETRNYQKKEIFVNVTKVAKSLNIEAIKLNIIFSELKWAKKEGTWWILTELGKNKGGKQNYSTKSQTKYITWNEKIIKDQELLNAIKNFKSKKETLKEKGDHYERYIAEYYERLGYYVWEHGKEKGKLDQGIDLIVKKKKEIIFIQCKNWNENTRFKIDHKEIKASRTEARAFMKENPLFIGYKMKFRFTISSNCIHMSAIKYIEENSELFDYEIIPINNLKMVEPTK